MNRQIRKLIFAALISAIGFIGTYSWYNQFQTQTNSNENETIVAFVDKTKDRSERRAVTRILWQEISQGDALYSGEAIRTSATSEVIIQFVDSKRYLELEPESLVVIQQNEGEISLDLMEGSVYVNNSQSETQTKQPTLTLNSANGKVDISKATAALSGSSSGKIDVQMIKGSATVKSEKGLISIEKGQSTAIGTKGLSQNKFEFNLISPQIEKPNYINLAQPKKILFKWKPLIQAQSVQIKVGESRKTMQVINQAEYLLEKNEALLSLNPGKYFFQINLNSGTQKIESPVYRMQVEALIPPSFLIPNEQEVYSIEAANQGIHIKWNGVDEYQKFMVELSTDPEFSQLVFKKEIQSLSYLKTPPLKPQNYYARVSGLSSTTDQYVTSKTLAFNVFKPEPTPLPQLIIDWGKTISEKIRYHSEKPSLNLDWVAQNAQNVKKWSVRIVPEGQDPKLATPVTLTEMKVQKQLDKAGRYIAMVEGLDENNQILGSTAPKKIEFQKIPLLKAPQILPLDQELVANQQGEYLTVWENLIDAKEYQITITDKTGKNIFEQKTKQAQYKLSQLIPGEYRVQLAAIDEFGRKGEASLPRPLLVPNESGLRPPKSSKIKILKGP